MIVFKDQKIVHMEQVSYGKIVDHLDALRELFEIRETFEC